MQPYERAAARAASYQLLARLLSEPVSAEILPYLNAIPDLSGFDLSANGVQFQQLFGFTLFPHESIFRDSSGLVGGTVSDEVVGKYQASRFRWQDEPDHVGTELRFLSFLSAAEADALEDQLPDVVAQIQQLQRDFLQAHLLQWLPPLTVAIQRLGDDFYRSVADLLWRLVCDHAEQLGVVLTEQDVLPPPDLASEKTGLKTIGRFLTSPHESGWWLSAGEMAEIGRKLDLPRGFGGRIQTMMNLFRSATQYDGASGLLIALQAQAKEWQRGYQKLGAYTESWQTRLLATVDLLQQMQAEVA